MTDLPDHQTGEGSNPPLRKAILPRILTGIAGIAIFTLIWFGLAGRITWIQGWAFILAFVIYVSALAWRMYKVNPDLLEERNQPASVAEPWDRIVMTIYSVALILLLVVVALDGGRYQWSTVPISIQILGWFFFLISGIVVWHVFFINAYLSSWARLQGERGQVVVRTGLYSRIRHPMYLGIILAFLGIPLLLGSWWALSFSFLIVGLFIYRTAQEDRMLINGLEGYLAYSQEVQHRLLPGIW